jgi:membrane-bound lytic murein transglycosylase A
MFQRLQPYRVETFQGSAEGLLTGYYEPMLQASGQQSAAFPVPLHRLPSGLPKTGRWFSRQEIDSVPEAKAALRGQELAWLADPLDALVLQIQGSGRLRIAGGDGSQRTVRLSYAGSNGHPYNSVGRWLLEQGLVREASWPAIRAWASQNPQRLNEMLWSNPRTVFFNEEPISAMDTDRGPKGAQGVELTPGRSIAVDQSSIPYGTPVWIASVSAAATLRRLVLAQDTGSAIVGAVRADFFTGWGEAAEDLAGRLKQGLRLWVLWPKGATSP